MPAVSSVSAAAATQLAGDVETPARVLGVTFREACDQEQTQRAHRQIDEKDPAPAESGQQQAAQQRTQGK